MSRTTLQPVLRALLVAVCALCTLCMSLDDDGRLYNIEWLPVPDTLRHKYQDEPVTIQYGTKDHYKCFLPRETEEGDTTQFQSTTHTAPEGLIALLKDVCIYRIEPYWSYELCLTRHLRQYHEDKLVVDGKKKAQVTEYYLGLANKRKDAAGDTDLSSSSSSPSSPSSSSSSSSPSSSSSLSPDGKPPTFPFQGEEYPYYSVTYKSGTVCDLTGENRETEIRFICDPTSLHMFASLSEVSTCRYMAVVATNALCSNDDYRIRLDKTYPIRCEQGTTDTDVKPAALSALEENQRLEIEASRVEEERQRALRVAQAEQLKTKKVDTSAQKTAGTAQAQAPAAKQQEVAGGSKQGSAPSTPSTPPPPPPEHKPMSKEYLRRLLQSNHCFTGDTRSWWQFEYCVNKHVRQIHRNDDGSKVVVNLGVWDESYHREQYRAIKPDKPNSKTFTHFYHKGDFCEAINDMREVRVKQACSTSLKDGQVSLYMEEKQICKYTLTVRSPLFCDLVEDLDSDGIPSF